MNSQKQVTQLNLNFPISYFLESAENSKKGLLVLHGFSDRGDAARKRMLGTDTVKGFHVLTPNALFPYPIKANHHYKEAYAWYFRDPNSGLQIIAPELAAECLLKLVEQLQLQSLSWTILGFSQGGFLAPYLVRLGLNANTIISVGASYRRDAYLGLPSIEVHAIHGELDTDVDFTQAKQAFLEIQDLGYGRDFHALSGVAHTLNPEGRELVRKILASVAT